MPDNNISTYTWTKIAGPAANIANANLAENPGSKFIARDVSI
jgi:hypothetical protein